MAGNQPCAHMHIHFLAFGRGHVYVVNYTTRTQQIAGLRGELCTLTPELNKSWLKIRDTVSFTLAYVRVYLPLVIRRHYVTCPYSKLYGFTSLEIVPVYLL